MKRTIFAFATLLGAVFAALGEGQEGPMASLTISSPDFRNNQPIPARHSCEGVDASPALNWSGTPPGTESFALICDDPDAPVGVWTHWVIYGIPPTTTALPGGVDKTDTVASLGGAKQGMNDFGRVGYGGPCPPRGHGPHHYHFNLFALKGVADLPPRASRAQLEHAMRGHVLAQADLVGTYERE